MQIFKICFGFYSTQIIIAQTKRKNKKDDKSE